MSVNFIKKAFLITILAIISDTSARIKRPDWGTSLINLSIYLKMDIDNAENELHICRTKLTDCESILLFIAKSNLSKAKIISKRILDDSNNKTLNIDDYFLNLRAAQVLAKNGETSYLTKLLDTEDKDMDDSYTLGYAKNFKYSDLILKPFLNSKTNMFCYYTSYIDPFLLNNSDALIKKIFSKVLGKNISEHNCAVQVIERNKQLLSPKYLSIIYKKIINLFNHSRDIKIREYIGFIDRWYIRFNNKDELIKVLLEYILKNGYFKNDQNIINIANNNLLMSYFETKSILLKVNESDKEIGYLEKVRITNGVIILTPIEFMLQKEFKKGWSIYFKEINEAQLIKLLSRLVKNNEKIIDRRKKLEYIFSTDTFKKSYVSQSTVVKFIKKEFSSEAVLIIKNLFKKSNNLQKSTLIAKYPKHFATTPVIRINTNDPWIKLAEITNLLTICKIDVPPVGSELSDPIVLTKYLEKGELLLKDCSRISK